MIIKESNWNTTTTNITTNKKYMYKTIKKNKRMVMQLFGKYLLNIQNSTSENFPHMKVFPQNT